MRTIQDLWVNNYIGYYKWHKIRSYSTAYCGTGISSNFTSFSERSNINEKDLCKICVRIIDKRRGV